MSSKKFSRVSIKKRGFLGVNWSNSELILWIAPLILVFLSTLLIASIQRQAFYTTWHQHLITAFIGVFLAFIFISFSLGTVLPLNENDIIFPFVDFFKV